MFIEFTCSRSEFKSWIALIFCSLIYLIWCWSLPLLLCGSLESLSLFKGLMYLAVPVLGAYIFRIVSSSGCIDLLPLYLCCFEIYFIRCENCNSCFLFIYLFLPSIWLVNLSPSLCFESLCILPCEMGLDAAYPWILAVSFD